LIKRMMIIIKIINQLNIRINTGSDNIDFIIYLIPVK